MMLPMATTELTLRKGADDYWRTEWIDETGRRWGKSFGRNARRAQSRFADFYTAWRSNPGVRNPGRVGPLTIREGWRQFATWAAQHYRRADGTATPEARAIAYAFGPVLDEYGDQAARDFGPKRLKAVRATMVRAGLCLNEVNKRTRKVRQVFRWLASEELVPAEIWHGLQAVQGLRAGEAVEVQPGTYAAPPETEPVEPVPDADVWAVEAELPRTVATMIRVQWLSGMRPQEVCDLRPRDLDTSGKVWLYRPVQHKTRHKGKGRLILLGPQAQTALKPLLPASTAGHVFSPLAAQRERWAGAALHRHQPNPAPQSGRRVGAKYCPTAYARAISYAIDAINERRREAKQQEMAHWSPNRLRHNAATRLRKEFGLDVAQIVLGHSTADVTQIYAELDLAKAVAAMERVG